MGRSTAHGAARLYAAIFIGAISVRVGLGQRPPIGPKSPDAAGRIILRQPRRLVCRYQQGSWRHP